MNNFFRICKLKLTEKNYVRKSIISFTPAPVPIIVTFTPYLSSIFFMNDFASAPNSSNDCAPAQSGNLTSNFVIDI